MGLVCSICQFPESKALTIADFKLPTWHRQAHKTPKNVTVGSHKLGQGRSSNYSTGTLNIRAPKPIQGVCHPPRIADKERKKGKWRLHTYPLLTFLTSFLSGSENQEQKTTFYLIFQTHYLLLTPGNRKRLAKDLPLLYCIVPSLRQWRQNV